MSADASALVSSSKHPNECRPGLLHERSETFRVKIPTQCITAAKSDLNRGVNKLISVILSKTLILWQRMIFCNSDLNDLNDDARKIYWAKLWPKAKA
jgi:hypothetical protein